MQTPDNDVRTLALIRAKYAEMTPKQQKIASFLLANPEAPIRKSITSLAQDAGIKSEASIVRFYRMLGFTGYHHFKVTLAQEIAGRAFYHSYDDISVDDSVESVVEKIFHGAILSLEENLQGIKQELFESAKRLLLGCNRIIFLGYAASGSIASYASFRFTDLGFDCHFSHDSHVNATVMAKPREGDLAFCISHSGETKDIVVPLERIRHAVPIIAITGFEQSKLGRLATVHFATAAEEANYRTDAMTSRIIQMTIIDTLFTVVSLSMGATALDRLKETRQALKSYKT